MKSFGTRFSQKLRRAPHLYACSGTGPDIYVVPNAFLYNRHHHTISVPMLICPHWEGNWKKESQVFFTEKKSVISLILSSTKMDYSSSLWLFSLSVERSGIWYSFANFIVFIPEFSNGFSYFATPFWVHTQLSPWLLHPDFEYKQEHRAGCAEVFFAHGKAEDLHVSCFPNVMENHWYS